MSGDIEVLTCFHRQAGSPGAVAVNARQPAETSSLSAMEPVA
jgi:hypothetical protein